MQTSEKIITLLIADDHEALRKGVAGIVSKNSNIKIVAEASNGLEAVALTELYHPDVIIMDIEMPLMRGVEATAIITQKHPDINIIAFSLNTREWYIAQMLEAGAKGYLLKSGPGHEIMEAIIAVSKDEHFFCTDISPMMLEIIATRRFSKMLQDQIEFSPIELQVINLICRQYSTGDMSKVLHRSPRTIEGYREVILKKIKARNAIGIVLYAIANKMFDPNSFRYNSKEQ